MQGIVGLYEGCYIQLKSICKLGGVMGLEMKKTEENEKERNRSKTRKGEYINSWLDEIPFGIKMSSK